MENENGELETLEPTEEVVTPEVTEEIVFEEDPEELKARLAKAEELANNYKIRAEKAEKAQKPKESPKTEQLTPKDLIALTRANIHEDDIAEVQEYAKFKGISLADAINSNVVKTMLNEKTEQRRVAEGTNTGASKRGAAKVSEESLLASASKGEMPDSEDDMRRLIMARKGFK